MDRKFNNAKSIQIQSTIFNSDVKSIFKAVSTIVHSLMSEEQENFKSSQLYYFSEEKYYIEERPEELDDQKQQFLRQQPSLNHVIEFMKDFYDCTQFSPECCIISLVYINRLIAYTNEGLNSTNWRPLLLSSLLIAQKVWDYRCLSNADFAVIYPFFTEIKKLESKFLELIQQNVTVKASLYAKYFFELKSLFMEDFPLTPLNVEQVSLLEARSADIQKKEEEKTQKLSLTQ